MSFRIPSLRISKPRVISLLCAGLGLTFGVLPPFGPQAAGAALSTALSAGTPVEGPTVFIQTIPLHDPQFSSLSSVSFTIVPRVGATATPISATFDRAYLQNRGWLLADTQTISVPVWGLYPDVTNTVKLTATHTAASPVRQTAPPRAMITTRSTKLSVSVSTSPYTRCSNYNAMQINTPRDSAVALGYSYFMLKTWNCSDSPIIMDIDGNVRWAGTMPSVSQASAFINQQFFLGQGNGTQLFTQTLDGTSTTVGDYSGAPNNVTLISHHNIDPGKNGAMLIDVDTNTAVESTILSVAPNGDVRKTFDVVSIFRQYIQSHCNLADPSVVTTECANSNPLLDSWLRPTNDWFHNNSATYWPARNELVVSSRENFVVGIDYRTKALKWILGDTNKAWYQTGLALHPLALALGDGLTIAPIGQHALSITPTNHLLLFDDGLQSVNQNPAGISRSYSAPREYAIDEVAKTATMTWSYNHNFDINSPICSSVYQVGNSKLIDYAADLDGNARLIGLGSNDQVAFDYEVPGGPVSGWNALPVTLTGLRFTG